MTLCPVALAVGCEKCPIVKVCPAKTVLGNYEPPKRAAAKPEAKKKPKG